jgi:hypothetical protein
MKKFIARLIGAAVVIGGMAYWMNRPYPGWEERTAADAGAEGATVAISIGGRDGAEERGALWVSCGGAGPRVTMAPGPVTFVGGGSVRDGATIGVAAIFREDPSPGGSAQSETWDMPAGKGMFESPDAAAFIVKLSNHGWVSIHAGGGGSMIFHVRRLGAFRERVRTECGLDRIEASAPEMPAGG